MSQQTKPPSDPPKNPIDQLEISWGPAADIRYGRGPIATEKLLLDEIERLLPRGTTPPSRPVLLVVPSLSLRLHLLERLVTTRGRGLLGFDCRTHHGFAVTALERSGNATQKSADVLPIMARRLARHEPALQRSLDHLRDGYGAVLRPVFDLLDAGLDPAHLEAAEEVLETEGKTVATPQAIDRALGLIRVATGSLEQLGRHRLNRSSILMQEAAARLRHGPEDLLPASHVLIYGFNDATGVTSDFLLALLGRIGGTVFLDHPPDPVNRQHTDSGLVFSRNYRERLEAELASAPPSLDPEPEARQEPFEPTLRLFRALGGEAEVREVAERISALQDTGAQLERIGVVARQLEPYARPLRIQFDRLGIPFSGVAAIGPYSPDSRRLHAVLQLLGDRQRTPIDRWLDASAVARSATNRNELLVAFHTLGAGRLADIAALHPDMCAAIEHKGHLPLPVRTGFAVHPEDDQKLTVTHRYVSADVLLAAIESARQTVEFLTDWPARAPAEFHRTALAKFLQEPLAWPTRAHGPNIDPSIGSARSELKHTANELPAALELDSEEFTTFMAAQLSESGRTRLGGQGGGVQVLDVVAARSRTFDHLFLMGMNRGAFPRVVQEDPLLPDHLRQLLGRSGFGILPDLPLRRSGFFEERYLFAQLLASSPAVTLSWQEVDDQQSFRTISPLVERLRLAKTLSADPSSDSEPATARPVFSPAKTHLERRRPAYEAAVLAGLQTDRPTFAGALRVGLAEAGVAPSPVDQRLAVLSELDPDLSTTEGAIVRRTLGPYFGFVGPIGSISSSDSSDSPQLDPRQSSDFFITALEGLARCPWRHFLQRVLRLEPLPDPLDAVPGLEPLLLGQIVHDVLERIVKQSLESEPENWDQALASSGEVVDWPSAPQVEALLQRTATALTRRRHLALPGLDTALARAAASHLEIARQTDWPDGSSRLPIIAAEIQGHLETSATPAASESAAPSRRILFRADRMDRDPAGPVLTDYKTGRYTPAKGSKADGSQRLLQEVASGEWLQAAAYALAGRSPAGQGRYLFLNPILDEADPKTFAISAGQDEMLERFAGSVSTLLDVWDRGTLFPRFLDWRAEKEPTFCSFCDVASACLRGDSGARGRLRDWMEQQKAPGDASKSMPAEQASAVYDGTQLGKRRTKARK